MEQKSNGPLVGSIIIIIILIIGGIYIWKTSVKEKLQNNNPTENVAPAQDSNVKIESDLNSTNLDGIDSGI
jgi:hypothetical protein